MANLDGSRDQRLVMDAPPFPSCFPAYPRFIHLDMLFEPPADPILIGARHGGAELVEDAERRLIAGQPKLALELDDGHFRRLTGDQIGGPEPHAERGKTALHDGADQ